MGYYVIGPDGNRYGPADIATLNQWIAQGRVTRDTYVEDAQTGMRMLASTVPGLTLGPPMMSAPTDLYGRYPQPGLHTGDDGSKDVTAAFLWGVAGLICCPIVFCIFGILAASRAKEKGNPNGQAAMIFNIVVLVISVAGAAFLLTARGGFPDLP